MKDTISAVIIGLFLLVTVGFAQEVQLLSPGITFTAKEVFFRTPVTYLDADKKPKKTRVALKLLLSGEGFYEGSTGPRYFLGKRIANEHYTSPDGKWVAVYFYFPLKLPRRAPILIETTTNKFVHLKQEFTIENVKLLSPEIRKKYDLPELLKGAMEK
jgi:hypothetical protein